jgi:tRNA uridine 5-carbamoylmethylation protein Kti12
MIFYLFSRNLLMMSKILIIATGIPCAGKSFLSSLIEDKYKNTYKILKIERDEIFGRIVESCPGIGSNRRNKLISEKMNEIYTEFNESLDNSILIVDSCSGNEGVRQFITDKAKNKTKTIIVNIYPKTVNGDLDVDFYLKRASLRAEHYVFPKSTDAQIKELQKCYSQHCNPQKRDEYEVINLEHDWTEEELKDKMQL